MPYVNPPKKDKQKISCPLCGRRVNAFKINIDTTFTMCESTECEYPFNQPEFETFFNMSQGALLALLSNERIVNASLSQNAPMTLPSDFEQVLKGSMDEIGKGATPTLTWMEDSPVTTPPSLDQETPPSHLNNIDLILGGVADDPTTFLLPIPASTQQKGNDLLPFQTNDDLDHILGL